MYISNNLVEERELYYLYERFLNLNPSESGCIANNQLLSMPEFKYCALKKQLPRALQLEFDSESNNIVEVPEEKEEKKEEDAVLNVNDNEEEINKTEKLALKDNDAKEEVKIEKNEKQTDEKKIIKETPRVKEEKNKEEKAIDVKMVTNEGKADEEVITPSGKQYIDFRKFCEILKIFNPRTPIDSKVNCTSLLN